jgi:hypothetical protein
MVPMNLTESGDEICFMDDVDAFTPQLAKKVGQRAILVKMKTYEETTGDVNHYTGQAGIVDNLIVTAMHNISSGPNRDGVLEETHNVEVNHAYSEREIIVHFEQLGVHVDSLTNVHVGVQAWDWGVDITWGARRLGPIPVVPDFSFEKVDNNFSYEVNMKVAIAVYLDEVPSQAMNVAPSAGMVTTDQLHNSHGPSNCVNVYTGKITAVGDDYIAYNINTFKGFSGALVFLSDEREQSASLRQEDLGKVIAVHAGYSSGLSSNIGFMIGKPNPPPTPPTPTSGSSTE